MSAMLADARSGSFELFCLASGMEALGEMMDHDAQAVCATMRPGLMLPQASLFSKALESFIAAQVPRYVDLADTHNNHRRRS
jgi:hypothetical protein